MKVPLNKNHIVFRKTKKSQYVGRLHREHENKDKVIVYDYLDNMNMLEKMYNKRLKGYKIAGYKIIE